VSETHATSEPEIAQHSVWQSIVLHLFPGALATVVYVLIVPPLLARGFPALFSLLIAVILIAIGTEVGILVYQVRVHPGRKASGRFSLQGVVPYREPMPLWQYPALIVPLIVWAFLVTGLLGPLDNWIGETLFAWLPDWYNISSLEQLAQFPRSTLILVFVLRIVLDGTWPIVEELYFRGYLLPRISRFGRWAPLINTLLFSLYHFWTPWQNVSRILFMWPIVYVTWWKRNIRIAIITHCLLNILGALLTLGLVLNQV
jgi:membrane protease YdiL (CAAX protease family)